MEKGLKKHTISLKTTDANFAELQDVVNRMREIFMCTGSSLAGGRYEGHWTGLNYTEYSFYARPMDLKIAISDYRLDLSALDTSFPQ